MKNFFDIVIKTLILALHFEIIFCFIIQKKKRTLITLRLNLVLRCFVNFEYCFLNKNLLWF